MSTITKEHLTCLLFTPEQSYAALCFGLFIFYSTAVFLRLPCGDSLPPLAERKYSTLTVTVQERARLLKDILF